MFAIALPAWAPAAAIAASVGLGFVLLLLIGGGVYGLARFIKNRKAGKQMTLASLSGLPTDFGAFINSPLGKEVITVLIQAAHNMGRAAMHALVAKTVPALVPFLPRIDSLADAGENALAQQLGLNVPGLANAATPAQPGGSIVIHSGHPLFDLVTKLMQAKADEVKAKGA